MGIESAVVVLSACAKFTISTAAALPCPWPSYEYFSFQHLVFLFKLVFPCLGGNGKSALANEMLPLEIYLRVRILFDVISGKN